MAILALRPVRAALGTVACVATVSCGGDKNHASYIDSAFGGVALQSDSFAGPAGGALLATLTEWNVDIPLDTVPPGRYTFVLRNDGRRTHALEVVRGADGNDTDVAIALILPGGAGEITVDLEPGVYELSCPLKDAAGAHDHLGMKRKLTVRRNTT